MKQNKSSFTKILEEKKKALSKMVVMGDICLVTARKIRVKYLTIANWTLELTPFNKQRTRIFCLFPGGTPEYIINTMSLFTSSKVTNHDVTPRNNKS